MVLEKIRTGLLVGPDLGMAGVTLKFTEEAYQEYYDKYIGKRVSMENIPFPESWYVCVLKEYNWSRLTVNSLLELQCLHQSAYHVVYYRGLVDDKPEFSYLSSGVRFKLDNITFVMIVREAK